MIGIDLIDLKDPLLKTRERAFRFILHPEDEFPDNEISFWLLWVAKEAIFKTRREVKSFDPKQIRVNIYESGTQMLFSSGKISGEIIVGKEHIMAVAQAANNTISYHIREKQTTDDSKEVRQYITDHFTQKKAFQINLTEDQNGLPLLDYRKIPISISHHGRFLSFAYPDF